jgi:phage terminase large subunit GpA-like protein
LHEEFESEDGIHRKINMLAVDAGFSTQEVYAWVRSQSSHIEGFRNRLSSTTSSHSPHLP